MNSLQTMILQGIGYAFATAAYVAIPQLFSYLQRLHLPRRHQRSQHIRQGFEMNVQEPVKIVQGHAGRPGLGDGERKVGGLGWLLDSAL